MAEQKQSRPIPELPPITRKTVESGLISEGAVSEARRPESSVSEAINLDFDAIGSARSRLGIATLANSLAHAVDGLYYHVNTVTPAYTEFIAVSNGVVYYLSGGTYTSIRTGLTAGSKARFCTFLNFVFMVNGTEATAVWDGNSGGSFVTSGNALNAPQGTFVENFRSQMWIAGVTTYPDRLYYSSFPSASAPQTVTWATAADATGQWIDISPSDGDQITCLHRTRNNMLVFKKNHIYRVYSPTQVDPDPYINVGTYSAESVVETPAGVFFHHSSGFYQYNIYGITQKISIPIIDVVKAIPGTSYTSVAGWLETDSDHVCWSIGNVTIGGVALTNVVVRYTISTQVWTMRSYPTQITKSADYNDGTNQWKAVADSSGGVYLFNNGTTDAGSPILYSLVHPWDSVDGLVATRKTISTVMFNHYQGSGSNVAYQVDGDPAADWSKKVGTFGQLNTGFSSLAIKGRRFRLRVAGQSTGQPFVYNGYEIASWTREFLQPKQGQ